METTKSQDHEPKGRKRWSRTGWYIILGVVVTCNLIMIAFLVRMVGLGMSTPKKRVNPHCNRAFDIDVELGRWDAQRSIKMIDQALVGDRFTELSREFPVCLATQTSLDKIDELIETASHWNGSISAAVFTVGNDEYAILQHYVNFLRECFPDIRDKVSFQLAFPKEKIPTAFCYNEQKDLLDCKKPEKTLNLLLELRSRETMNWRREYWYPQNHMRNLARKNCPSQNVFLTDVEIIPSYGMAEQLRDFLKIGHCKHKCAYVVPTYEMSYAVPMPTNKHKLLNFINEGYARPFLHTISNENQAATNFPKWETDTVSNIHVSYELKDISYPYEPYYMASADAPPHDETLVGPGYAKSTQVYEMAEAGWHFYVLSPVFTIHWGLADDRIPLWKDVEHAYNRENVLAFKEEVRHRYKNNYQPGRYRYKRSEPKKKKKKNKNKKKTRKGK